MVKKLDKDNQYEGRLPYVNTSTNTHEAHEIGERKKKQHNSQQQKQPRQQSAAVEISLSPDGQKLYDAIQRSLGAEKYLQLNNFAQKLSLRINVLAEYLCEIVNAQVVLSEEMTIVAEDDIIVLYGGVLGLFQKTAMKNESPPQNFSPGNIELEIRLQNVCFDANNGYPRALIVEVSAKDADYIQEEIYVIPLCQQKILSPPMLDIISTLSVFQETLSVDEQGHYVISLQGPILSNQQNSHTIEIGQFSCNLLSSKLSKQVHNISLLN